MDTVPMGTVPMGIGDSSEGKYMVLLSLPR